MEKQKFSYIYAVRYEKEKRHISQVNARIDPGTGTLESIRFFWKSEILSQIDNGYIVKTMVKSGEDYIEGAKVIACTINGKRFLKTVANDIEEDNLGGLPNF